MITIPFDLELAKKINNGERNGMIVTDGDNYRVEFVYHREESFSILGVIHTDHGIISDWFSNNGFGGKNYRLKLKVPEYTTFKDGDVLSNEQGDYLFILNTNGEYLTSFHASWKKGRGVVIPRKAHADCNNIEKYRLATEDERQKFIDALKTSKEPKAKMCLKQFFGIEIEPEYKFKPFDKVLVRDTPERREAEHRQNRNFDKMKIVGNVSTLDGASQWETNRIQTYMNNHKGQTPLYNQNEHGK